MNKIKIPDINLNEFDYDLPKDRIALYPAAKRDESRLLIANIDSQIISHGCFKDISNVIPENSLLVLNETKVIQARLLFRKPTGGKVEFLLVEPVEPSGVPVITLESKGKCRWDCIVGGKRVREGMLLETAQEGLNLQAKIIERDNNTGIIEFIWDSYKPFSEIIEVSGAMPLPPYIDRESEQIDKKRYQTVYANNNGSVAAPTAGLHFTDNVFADLRKKNIEITNITLHVGPGTFQPIAGNDISKHAMHYEHIYISKKTIESIIAAKKKGRNIIAVGTTCCRTVESLYWHALKLYNNVDTVNDINISQWEPYQHTELPSTVDMFTFLLNHLELNEKDEISGKTQLFIVPGYDFRVFNGLITNFHLPKSTLILLVAAFTGKSFWAKIYENALNNDFRFLSYGDSTILLKSIG